MWCRLSSVMRVTICNPSVQIVPALQEFDSRILVAWNIQFLKQELFQSQSQYKYKDIS